MVPSKRRADVRHVSMGVRSVNVGAYRVWNSRVGYVVMESQNPLNGAWHSVLWQGDAANGLRDLLDTTSDTFTVHNVMSDVFAGHPYEDCDCAHNDITAHADGYYSHTLLYWED